MKSVYRFEEGNAGMKMLLGGKGANLAEMTSLGLPIPPGFTITTEACRAYYAANGQLPEGLLEEMELALRDIERQKGAVFGGNRNPLLVSVRSGSVASMPGMMDTVLNLGLNDLTVRGLAEQTGNEAFAYDCYRRFIQMFGEVVLGIEALHFGTRLEELKHSKGRSSDQEVAAEEWKALIAGYFGLIEEHTGSVFPQEPLLQLKMAVEAVFRSWNNSRAKVYRKAYGIPDEQGTAVNIQAMVFGNLGGDSGTGVLFTRNPSTGERVLYGEYLVNAQGEDVVAGIRTPSPIRTLKENQPAVYEGLSAAASLLERHYRDMQDIEFTVEKEKLYLLQTRSGKRTAQAAVKIAVNLMEEGILSREDAVSRIEAGHLDQLLHRSVVWSPDIEVIAQGLPASPGAASGVAVFDADKAEQWAKDGKKVVLVGTETSPEDIHGIIASQGVLTSRGGMTSHAAVVARGMGKPCVCGCGELVVDLDNRLFTAGGRVVREGDPISIDGSSGKVISGSVALNAPEMTDELAKLLDAADDIRSLAVYANADTPEDAIRARMFGAEGIGLCRTEHMFMSPDRLPAVRAMILADDDTERKRALDRILPMQQNDFEAIFTVMAGLPVTIRLLDPPLHEFLPELEDLLDRQRELEALGEQETALWEQLPRTIRKVRELQEMNPMLGLRGCRLGLLFPDIYEMQAAAIFRAVKACMNKGIIVKPDVMIPLVGHPNELKGLRERINHVAAEELGTDLKQCQYRVGTMIEVPRAALVAGEIARYADFFSFGTNDLTQMTYGYSRDDAEGKFLQAYLEHGILETNPFQVLDEEGVGQLMEWAVQRGSAVNPLLKTGVCGEHGGNRESILFCHEIGLDYVSCSPFRVPFARIAAAQAALMKRTKAETAKAVMRAV